MSMVERAAAFFDEGYNCSQAILATYGPALGLPRDLALRLADSFGGGISGLGETCGAVSGALMVIGLQNGRLEAQDIEAKDRTREAGQEFVKRFEARNGSIMCRALLACDISTPEGLARAREEGLFAARCPALVRSAAEILEGIIQD